MSRNPGSKKSLLQRVCDSTAARTLGLVSAVVGLLPLGSIPYERAAVTVNGWAPAAHGSGTAPLPPAARRPTFQLSSGAQSPNVSGVRHGVHILYASTVGVPEGSPGHTSLVAPSNSVPAGSNVQVSQGAQSPNVSGVRGNVDIRYGSLAAVGPEKLPEADR